MVREKGYYIIYIDIDLTNRTLNSHHENSPDISPPDHTRSMIQKTSSQNCKGYCENCPCTDDGWSPLLIATQRRDAEAVETLLFNGAEVDCKEPQSGWQLVCTFRWQ